MNNLPNNSADQNAELQKLLAELVEGTISDEQFQSLGNMLVGNPQAQQQYRRYVELHAMLQFEHQPQPAVLSDANADVSLLDALFPDTDSTDGLPGVSLPWFGGWPIVGFLVLVVVAWVGFYAVNRDKNLPLAPGVAVVPLPETKAS